MADILESIPRTISPNTIPKVALGTDKVAIPRTITSSKVPESEDISDSDDTSGQACDELVKEIRAQEKMVNALDLYEDLDCSAGAADSDEMKCPRFAAASCSEDAKIVKQVRNFIVQTKKSNKQSQQAIARSQKLSNSNLDEVKKQQDYAWRLKTKAKGYLAKISQYAKAIKIVELQCPRSCCALRPSLIE